MFYIVKEKIQKYLNIANVTLIQFLLEHCAVELKIVNNSESMLYKYHKVKFYGLGILFQFGLFQLVRWFRYLCMVFLFYCFTAAINDTCLFCP